MVVVTMLMWYEYFISYSMIFFINIYVFPYLFVESFSNILQLIIAVSLFYIVYDTYFLIINMI